MPKFTPIVGTFIGDSGSGGNPGLVPAPPAGSQASNEFLQAGGSWQVPPTAVTGGYAQVYFTSVSQWNFGTTAFSDGTPIAGPSFVVRWSAGGISIAAAGSSLPGFAISPPTTSAAYEITAQIGMFNNSAGKPVLAQLVAGTSIISGNAGWEGISVAGGNQCYGTNTLRGFWAPGTTTSSALKVQLATGGGSTASIIGIVTGGTMSVVLEFSVLRIV